MNKFSGGPWRFRWGKKAGLESLGKILPGVSMISRRWFRGVPLIAWIAGIAVHDLRKPDSRIKAFARRLVEKRGVPRRIRTIIVPPPAIEGPDTQKKKMNSGEQQ